MFIPEYQTSVKVLGAVNSPGSVPWQRGQGLDYYISAASGYAFNGDKVKLSVRFANGACAAKANRAAETMPILANTVAITVVVTR